jgi:dethiobiotin synthetase
VSVLFVTGAGTEIGKTYVTCCLVRQQRAAGKPVRAVKPVASGIPALADPIFQDSDTARLLSAQGLSCTESTVAACTPWRFAAPLSPDMAAAAEDRTVKLADVVAWSRGIARDIPSDGLLLIEGVGGVMSPLANDGLNIDLISALGCPAVLVGGSYLGAISHTLTAITALRGRNIELRTLVVNETADSSVGVAETLASLARFAPDVRLLPLRHGEGIAPETTSKAPQIG